MRRLPQHIGLLLLIYLCFISLGLPDGILGAAWPAIRMDMQQPLAAVGLMSVTMTVCSAISSLSAGTLTRHWGTGPIVATSGLMTALALLGFAHAPSFGWLLALVVPPFTKTPTGHARSMGRQTPAPHPSAPSCGLAGAAVFFVVRGR